MEDLYITILAAGKGTRMNSDLPKVLFKIKDKTLIERCVDNAKEAGPKKVIVVVGHKKEMVMDVLKDNVEYAVQDQQLGTGHALMQTNDFFNEKNGYLIVSNGDMPFISGSIYKHLFDLCRQKSAEAAMLSVETDQYPSWGRVVRKANGEVLRIVEAKDANESILKVKEKNTGIYCFKIKDLFQSINRIKSENAQQEYYLTDVIEILGNANKKVIAVSTAKPKNIIGINTPEELKAARQAFI
jgi:UDP-N-acetylglucosamine diphosphorylase/glucosamine-1-phosphate N-acetyltransferase